MQNEQLTTYIQQAHAMGVPLAQIRQNLLSSGWSALMIEAELARLGHVAGPLMPSTPTDPHRVRNGVLWILSGYILIFLVIMIQIILAPIAPAGSDSTVKLVVNILSLVAGLAAVILLPVGFVVGIIKLTKK